jgi:hypothetical protein
MPDTSLGRGYLALVRCCSDLSRGKAGEFIKYRAQLFGANDRILTGLDIEPYSSTVTGEPIMDSSPR